MAKIIKLNKESKRQYYSIIEEDDGNMEIIEIEQNREAKNNDHWRIAVNMNRWRTKDRLIAYLKAITSVVEVL